MKLLVIFISVCLVQCTLGAKILAVLPMPAPSHAILIERLLRSLDEKGHEVTYLTSTVPHKPLGNTQIVHIPGLREILMKGMPHTNNTDNLLLMRGMSRWMSILIMPKMGTSLSEYILAQEQAQSLIKSNEKFDLILGEIFLDECILAGLSHRFNAPIVAVQTFMPGLWANRLVGNPAPAAFIPDPLIGYSDKMSFFERVNNFLYSTVNEIWYTMYTLPSHDAIMRKYFAEDYPPIEDILRNTSLVLVNHHFSLGFPRPYVPNMIEIAGMHIDKPNPLPKDLKEFMGNSKNGVILFSLGSNVKSKDLPQEKIDALLSAFSKLKQNILWKFEGDFPNLPKNVKIMKWLPQSDILAHPNLKLFITHGGLLSTTEAVDRGVPVVGIPIFADQPLNMKHTENAGLGKTLDYEDISPESVYNTVSEVLNNPKYKEAAQQRSKLLKDNPVDSLGSAIWWIEYVLRHKGARHLRSASQDLAWYQLYLFDVYALAALILIPILYVNVCITKKILRKLCGLCCKSSQTASVNKKNK